MSLGLVVKSELANQKAASSSVVYALLKMFLQVLKLISFSYPVSPPQTKKICN